MDETKTALGIGQMATGASGQLAAHPTVDLPAHPGNGLCLMHAVADNQPGPGLFGAPLKSGQILRHMLAVAVEGDRPAKAQTSRLRQTGPERGTLAEIPGVTQDRCSGGLGPRGRIIH